MKKTSILNEDNNCAYPLPCGKQIAIYPVRGKEKILCCDGECTNTEAQKYFKTQQEKR